MNGRAVIVRSFARIHEANLKKQGVLALTFANPDDYERIQVDDTIDIVGLAELAPGRPVDVVIHHANGTSETISTTHTMSDEHIAWFRAGSALNVLRGELTSAERRELSLAAHVPRPDPVVVLAVDDDAVMDSRPSRSTQ